MDIRPITTPTTTPADKIEADAVVVSLYQDESPQGAAAEVDKATGGAITRLIELGDVTGKANELVSLLAPAGVATPRLLIVGLGCRDKFDRNAAFEACGTAAKQLAGKQRGTVAFCLESQWPADTIEAAIAGAIVGCQGQDLYRAEKKLTPFSQLLVRGGGDGAINSGIILGESINFTRHLVNEPPQAIYPESFADAAAEMAAECGLEIEVWDQARLEKENCGSLLAVGRGSSRPPRLVIMRHKGAPDDASTLALVGKGVTFDSGGLSLKPTDGMLTMKCDMAGGATVVGAMRVIALLNLEVNVIGLVGLAENMVSADCYKLGDVLTARNGRTIEVHNTDAEGRLVLADVLSTAVDEGATRIIDLATLTGACVVALGLDVAGLMSNDDTWRDAVADAAKACGEPAWPLPMFSSFDEQIKSKVADIKNVGEGRWGGAITAAKFLEQFVGDVPWTHIDIAGPAFREKPKSFCDAGASGQFVRTLVEITRRG